MKTKHYVIIGVITYFLFLVSSIPATTLTHLLNKSFPQINIQGVSGTLWNGKAQRITLSSQHTFSNASWSTCAWRLIIAEVCINLDGTYKNKTIQGQIGLGIMGTIIARDLKAEIDAQSLGNLAELPLGELGGLVIIHLESASWSAGQLPAATGNILWKNAAVTITETAELGDTLITLSEGEESLLTANISNKGGDITLSGITHISDDGSYNIELKLSPNNTASETIRSSLKLFAQPQNDGSFVLKNTGNLRQFGIM